ncbi:hypothetical protein [Rhizobium sp. R693]|uniref:hypothetical protein n=1 Tax=Rhizobium sp. R693 TaxID=1764276 RepID=UPI000B52E80C|nr:hypothetical protein [Rhizobium sp. R693]OWV96903.1 hypothetical protein ATY79_24535 [Rhizobium sp. R693]
MVWALLILFTIGAACAPRVPILIVTLIVVVVMIAYAIVSYSNGSPFLHTIGWGLIFAGALQAGHLFMHGVLHFLYVRRAGRGHTSGEVRSRYSAD